MYLGIDTHKRYSQVAVVDDDGNLHDEIRTLRDLVRTRKSLVEERMAEKTGSEPFSHAQPTPTTASCSAQLGESSSQNARSDTSTARSSRPISR